jgi:type II secretory pathway component GspD/PulD (secretin)
MDTLTPEQAIEQAKGLTFEKVWLAIMETRKSMEESQEKTQESIKETQKAMKESQEAMRESQEETRKIVKELSQNIGGVNNTIGKLTEAIFSPDIEEKFDGLGYNFITAAQNKKFKENKRLVTEADIFLENTTHTMAIEVKTELEASDIDKHIQRIEKIKKFMTAHNDNRKLLGGIAGAIIAKEETITEAQDKGLFVFVLSGESAKIAPAKEDFIPKEW